VELLRTNSHIYLGKQNTYLYISSLSSRGRSRNPTRSFLYSIAATFSVSSMVLGEIYVLLLLARSREEFEFEMIRIHERQPCQRLHGRVVVCCDSLEVFSLVWTTEQPHMSNHLFFRSNTRHIHDAFHCHSKFVDLSIWRDHYLVRSFTSTIMS
jgi:hypothetical protein